MNAALPPEAGPEPALEWTFNPWRQDVGKAVVGVIMTAAIAGLISSLGLPMLAAVAMTLAVLLTVQAAFLPMRCRVDEDGVARRLTFAWERRPWAGIRKARLAKDGLFVSPRLRAGVLASLQGMWLPVPAAAPPTLVDELRQRLVRHGLL